MSNKTLSKRQELREMRRRQERRQRILTIGAIITIVLVLVGLLIAPTIRDRSNFVQITPVAYPNTQGTTMGDPNAPVKIEVFEDFQCTACITYSENVEPQIAENLVKTGKVYYVFRNYPFMDDGSASKDSDRAANAAMCASEQERFWDFHHILYANYTGGAGNFTDDRLFTFARFLKLDMGKFETCYNNAAYQDVIDNDIVEGDNIGVNGTPSLFVNGKQIAPGFVPTYEQVLQAVEEAMQTQ